MRTHLASHRTALLALSLFAFAALPAPARAQACNPGSCLSTFHLIDFESFAPGTAVEGLGAVDPVLDIESVAWPFGPNCPPGTARVIEEGNPIPFVAYSTGPSGDNGCLGGIHGFADPADCAFDYDFTFAAGISVTCFTIRMVDYSDYFPFGGPPHEVRVTAYDASSTVVDQDILSAAALELVAGDACDSQAGQPGNYRFIVAGSGIVKVTLRFVDSSPDPNVGFDEIGFCAVATPTPVLPRSWGEIKTIYR